MKPKYRDIDVLLLLRKHMGGEWAVVYLLGDTSKAVFEQFLEPPTSSIAGPDDDWYLTTGPEEVVDQVGIIYKQPAERWGKSPWIT